MLEPMAKVPDAPPRGQAPRALLERVSRRVSSRSPFVGPALVLALVVPFGCGGDAEPPPGPGARDRAPEHAPATLPSGAVADERAGERASAEPEFDRRAAGKPELLPARRETEAASAGEPEAPAASREVVPASETLPALDHDRPPHDPKDPVPEASEPDGPVSAGREGAPDQERAGAERAGEARVGEARVGEADDEEEGDTEAYADGADVDGADAGDRVSGDAGSGDASWRDGPGAEPFGLAVPAGTRISLTLRTPLSTRENREGDSFHAVTADDVLGVEGVVLVPRGADVFGRVTASRESPGSEEPALLSLVVQEVVVDGVRRPLRATIVEVEAEAESRDGRRETATKVGVGAAAGALLGKLLGGDSKDALRGAIAGAAAGTVVALATGDGHAEIGEGARIVVRLDEPLVVEAP